MVSCTPRLIPEKAVFRAALALHVLQPEFTGEQDMAHGAIETLYKGCRFRSRLEARWAVFFDALGIEWQYEVQGYEVDGHRYLPDFWLPKLRCWAEVKGDPEGLRKEVVRMNAILGLKSPLPGFLEGRTALVVLGDIPSSSATVFHPVLHRIDAGMLQKVWGMFVQTKRGADIAFDRAPSWLYHVLGKPQRGDHHDAHSSMWDVDVLEVQGNGSWPLVTQAYQLARGARFEHGESGGRA